MPYILPVLAILAVVGFGAAVVAERERTGGVPPGLFRRPERAHYTAVGWRATQTRRVCLWLVAALVLAQLIAYAK